MFFMMVLRDRPCARVASSIASHPSGASSTNSARTWSVRRIRHGAPGVICSPVMKPSVIQRCRVGGGSFSSAAASTMVNSGSLFWLVWTSGWWQGDVPVVPQDLDPSGGEGQSCCGGTVLPVEDAGDLGVGVVHGQSPDQVDGVLVGA